MNADFTDREQLLAGSGSGTNESEFERSSTGYFDVASGIEFHNNVYSIGFSAFNMNRPNNGFFTNDNIIPMRFNFHGGARLSVEHAKIYRPLYRLLYNIIHKEIYINPEFLFKKQSNFSQLDIGVNVHYGVFMFGVWNRGIPLNEISAVGNDAIALLFGYSDHGLSLAYSYDVTTSNQTVRTGGAHELSVTYLFDLRIDRKKPVRKHQIIPCPQF